MTEASLPLVVQTAVLRTVAINPVRLSAPALPELTPICGLAAFAALYLLLSSRNCSVPHAISSALQKEPDPTDHRSNAYQIQAIDACTYQFLAHRGHLDSCAARLAAQHTPSTHTR